MLGISLESVNYPHHYLRHQNSKLYLHKYEASTLFKKDATFTVHEALDGKKGGASFQTVNFPHHYIYHQEFRVYKRKFQNTALYKHGASWLPVRKWLFPLY